MNSRKFIISILLLISYSLLAQVKEQTFTIDKYLWIVANYHPIAKQANLTVEEGKSTILKSRGAFDPYFYGGVEQKQFNNKEYYNVLGAGLKIPTWYGIELKTDFEQNRGFFINPESYTPESGLLNAGASITLGQGLLIDKRRTTLKQAQIYSQSTKYEQQLILNSLFYEASVQYWKWVESWNNYQLLEEAILLAKNRFEAVKSSFIVGDKPAIDTVEAFLQLQNRQLDWNQFKLQYQNETIELSNFLWYENNVPIVITDSIQPPLLSSILNTKVVSADSLQRILLNIEDNHPEILLYQNKIATLILEKRLKQEELKPKVNFNYNFLNETIGNNTLNTFSTQNYKWGIEVSFPIFIREQRGALQLTKIKIQDVDYSLQQKKLEVQNKIKKSYNEQMTLNEQVTLYSEAVNNYKKLLEGEKINFFEGESSLFLVNSREQKLIEAQLKLIELQSKFYKSYNNLFWSAGLLHNLN